MEVIPLPHPSGASTWFKVEPGRTLLAEALQLLARHPEVRRALEGTPMSRVGVAALAPALALATGRARPAPRGGGGVPEATGAVELGLASFYADALRGRPTASGAPYDPAAFTCAHRTAPFGTRLRVTELAQRAERGGDRQRPGPLRARARGRSLPAAAAALGIIGPGVARVRVERLRRRPGPSPPSGRRLGEHQRGGGPEARP